MVKNEIKTGHARARLGSEIKRKEGDNWAEETSGSEESAGSYKKLKRMNNKTRSPYMAWTKGLGLWLRVNGALCLFLSRVARRWSRIQRSLRWPGVYGSIAAG